MQVLMQYSESLRTCPDTLKLLKISSLEYLENFERLKTAFENVKVLKTFENVWTSLKVSKIPADDKHWVFHEDFPFSKIQIERPSTWCSFNLIDLKIIRSYS